MRIKMPHFIGRALGFGLRVSRLAFPRACKGWGERTLGKSINKKLPDSWRARGQHSTYMNSQPHTHHTHNPLHDGPDDAGIQRRREPKRGVPGYFPPLKGCPNVIISVQAVAEELCVK